MAKQQRNLTLRQGDVFLIYPGTPGYRKPTGKRTPVQPEAGRLLLAKGEVTGHHHSVPKTATLTLDEGGVMYMTLDQLTEVVHQEHGPVSAPAGTDIEVRICKEYAPEAVRNVAD